MGKKKEKAFIIDSGNRGMCGIRKCVTFKDGVGVLDHAGVAQHRPDIYNQGASVEGRYPRPSGRYIDFDLSAIAEYFEGLGGFKVTEVSEKVAEKARKALRNNELPGKKYLVEPPSAQAAETSSEAQAAETSSEAQAAEADNDNKEVEPDDLEGPESENEETDKGKASKSKKDKKGGKAK